MCSACKCSANKQKPNRLDKKSYVTANCNIGLICERSICARGKPHFYSLSGFYLTSRSFRIAVRFPNSYPTWRQTAEVVYIKMHFFFWFEASRFRAEKEMIVELVNTMSRHAKRQAFHCPPILFPQHIGTPSIAVGVGVRASFSQQEVVKASGFASVRVQGFSRSIQSTGAACNTHTCIHSYGWGAAWATTKPTFVYASDIFIFCWWLWS